MKFTCWSFGHYLFILSPIIFIVLLHVLLRKRSEKIKYIVGVILGVLSLGILLMRNIDIYVRNGFDPEIIPFQVCHFGNIMVFIALVFKNKVAATISWCLNLGCAYAAIIYADGLANYDTILCIRAQAYIWGHIVIVVGAYYALGFKIVRINFKCFLKGLGVLGLIAIPAIFFNSYFNDYLGESINYMYLYNSKGTPLGFLDDGIRSSYGWFTINWSYTLSVMGVILVLLFGIYYSHKLLFIKKHNQ